MSEAERRQWKYVACPRCKARPDKHCKDDVAAYGDTYSGLHRERVQAVREFLEDAPFILMQKLERIEEMLEKQARGRTRESEPKSNEDSLGRSVWGLGWSVRAEKVIQSRFPDSAQRALIVADLVAIPPAEWLKVPRCGMLILREMDKMFKSLGVEWPGEWPRK